MISNKWKFYFQTFGEDKNKLIFSTIINIIQPIILLPIVLLVRYIIDDIIPQKNTNMVILAGATVLVLYIISNSITFLSQKIILRTVKTAILNLREQIVNKLYMFPRSFYDNTDVARLHTIVVQDTNRLDFASNIVISSLIPSLIISGALGCILFFLNIKLFLIMMIITPLIVLLSRIGSNKIKIWTKKSHRLFEIITKGLLRVLQIMDLTVQRSAERFEMDRQLQDITAFRDVSYKHAWIISVYQSLQSTLIAFSGVLILVVGGIAVINELLSLGNLISFYVATGMLKAQMSTVTRSIPIAIEGYESLTTIYNLYQTEYDITYQGSKRIKFTGYIKLKAVDFSYGKNELLKSVNLNLSPGSITVICGPNGSGKSTIVNLILGNYKPQYGWIYADGCTYQDVDISQLRKDIGVVTQNPIIFPASIWENLTYGYPGTDNITVKEAASAANINYFIEQLPMGYDTMIGEQGVLLSGGEYQGIAIARALLLKPKLLILDEPTNNLDDEKIGSLIKNLKNLSYHPAILLISHNKLVQQEASQTFIIKDKTLIEI